MESHQNTRETLVYIKYRHQVYSYHRWMQTRADTGKRTPISEDSSLEDNDSPGKRTVYVGGLGQSGPIYGCTVINQNFTVGTDAEQTDRRNLYNIYDAIKLKNIDEKLFYNICQH